MAFGASWAASSREAPPDRAKDQRLLKLRPVRHGPPLPHHRTYGSRIRRFGGLSQGEPSPQPEHRFPACQRRVHPRCRARSPTPRRMPSHRSTSGNDPCPPFGPSAHPRCGSAYLLPRLSALGCLTSVACAGPTMPSADFCGAVREDGSALSPLPGHPADLPRSAVIPSVHRRRMDQARPSCGWRTLWSRAHSSRAYHTSYPVRVPRPAHSFHASFRPHLTVTPLRFPCPSAPRTPGRGTCTPKHDRMHGTHASVSRAVYRVRSTVLLAHWIIGSEVERVGRTLIS